MTQIQLQSVKPQGRMKRKPNHTFLIAHSPYEIQPFLLAPVQAGETLNSFDMQARTVSSPLKNSIGGWWYEFYFFFVSLQNFSDADNVSMQSMLLDPNFNADSAGFIAGSNSLPLYTAAGTMDWSNKCLQAVTSAYFRQEGEAWDNATYALSGLPLAAVNSQDWTDMLMIKQDLETYDVNVDINADATVTAGEVDKAMKLWEMARYQGLTQMSYEEYLSTFGVKQAEKLDPKKPELLRFIRQWSYPTNTVNPSDGSPSSAISLSFKEQGNKKRYFKEHGFVFGVAVARPKVFKAGLNGSASGALDNAFMWLPSALRGDAQHSVATSTMTANLMQSVVSYDPVFDVRDLFLYGDQFVNCTLETGDILNVVTLPDPYLNKTYANQADIAGYFVSGSGAFRSDGIVSLDISGSIMDINGSAPVLEV